MAQKHWCIDGTIDCSPRVFAGLCVSHILVLMRSSFSAAHLEFKSLSAVAKWPRDGGGSYSERKIEKKEERGSEGD